MSAVRGFKAPQETTGLPALGLNRAPSPSHACTEAHLHLNLLGPQPHYGHLSTTPALCPEPTPCLQRDRLWAEGQSNTWREARDQRENKGEIPERATLPH